MRCNVSRDELQRFFDRETSEKRLTVLKGHTDACPRCRNRLSAFHRERELLSLLGEIEPRDAYYSSFSRMLAAERQKAGERRPAIAGWPRRTYEGLSVARPAVVRVATAIAVAAFMLPIAYQLARLGPTRIVSVTGPVEICRARTNRWLRAAPGAVVGRGDSLRTGTEGRAVLETGVAARVVADQKTEIKLVAAPRQRLAGRFRYQLIRGRALVTLRHRMARYVFDVDTEAAIARAWGTKFLTAVVPPEESTRVAVYSGHVEVISRYQSPLTGEPAAVRVPALSTVIVRRGTMPGKVMPFSEADAYLESYLEGVLRGAGEPVPGEEAPVSQAPISMRIMFPHLEERVKDLLEICAFYSSDTEKEQVRSLRDKAADLLSRGITEKDPKTHREGIEKLEEIVNLYPHSAYNPQYLLLIGAHYAYIRDYEKAMESFKKVLTAHSDTDYASIALGAMGFIEEEMLKDPRKAKGFYRELLERYPHSPEAKFAEKRLKVLS